MTTILLVRHGRTAWNREERFRGQVDLPLDDWGRQQAELVGQRIAHHWEPAAIYASSLQRTLQTAACVARACGLRTTIHDGLLDIDYGSFAGLTPDEAADQHPDLARAIGQAYLEAVIATGATGLVSLDASCFLHLRGVAASQGKKL